MKVLKTMWTWIKKFWWIVLALLAFIAGVLIKKSKKVQVKIDLESIKQQKMKELEELEKKLEDLKKEEQEIYKKKHFDNVNDAIDYLNDVLKRQGR